MSCEIAIYTKNFPAGSANISVYKMPTPQPYLKKSANNQQQRIEKQQQTIEHRAVRPFRDESRNCQREKEFRADRQLWEGGFT
jgi:hypothetical protein